MEIPRFYSVFEQSEFICGATSYFEEAPYTSPDHARIVVNATPEGGPSTLWVVDTGAPWCVIDPNMIKRFPIQYEVVKQLSAPIIIRGQSYDGKLIRINIRLIAYWGENLDIEATAFLADLDSEDSWNLPNFIGLGGYLSRMRFAIDPFSNTLFFGNYS